jgi:hypothetical protein
MDTCALDSLTPQEVAHRLRIQTVTLRLWRVQNRGPVFFRCGRRIRYRVVDLNQWISENLSNSGPTPTASATAQVAMSA